MTDPSKQTTEHQRAEDETRASDSLYRELVRNANSAIIRWRVDGTITFFNEYAEAFFGWRTEEVIGRHVGILVPEQESTGADLTGLVRDIIEHPEKYINNVNENVCRDGRRVWMIWTNKPIRDEQGSVTEILAIGSSVTALKQAETSLRGSEQRLLLALEAAFSISFEWDIQRNQVRRFMSQEPALAATSQQKPGTFEDVLEVVHPNDRELFQANIDAALQSENGHYESQFRIVRPDGEIAWLHECGRVESDGQGRPCRLIGLSQDITDRKQAEEALQQSREDLDRAQAVGKIGWWRLDTCSNVLTWSAENHRIFGAPQGTPMSYETFLAIVHPDDRRYVDTQWKAGLRGEPYDIEHRIVVEGQVKWVREKAYLEFDHEGHLLGGFGITQDITARKLVEEELRVANERFAIAFSANPAGIALSRRRDGLILDVNETWLTMFGYRREEIIGKPVMSISFWPTPEDRVRAVADLLEQGSYRDREQLMLTQSGESLITLGSADLLTITGEEVILSTWLDITERKQAEKALRTSRERMELLAAVAQRLLRAEDPQVVVEELCRRVMTHIDCQFFFNYLVEEPGRRMRLNAYAGIPEDVADTIRRLDFGVAVCGSAARDRVRIIAEDIQDSNDPRTELVKSFGVQAYCCHPLLLEGEVIGTLSFGTRTRPALSTDEVELMRSVADPVSVAMHRLQVNQSLRNSEARIKASLGEKEVLLKEIHHRVKNNMQVISSLVDLQADEVADAGMRAIFQDVVHRVRSLAMVHEKLYQSSDLARVEFADYTNTLLGYLWRAQRGAESGIQLDLNLTPVYLPVNQAVPCGLMLNELFSNALKHAFAGREKGRIAVSLQEDGDGMVHLEISDDGIGLPNGLDWHKASSLGLRLVQMLARQLKAEVTADDGAGTVFTISFAGART